MKTYLIEMAVINSAAQLSGLTLKDNYAIFGALKRFRSKSLGEVFAIEGLEDMEERAASYRFGNRCGRVMAEYVDGLTEDERLAVEAYIARTFFVPEIAEDSTVSETDKKETLKIVIEALVKRAQIRTHTAKPGGEDINLWLDRYNKLQISYLDKLGPFVSEIIAPSEESLKLGERFIDRKDKIVELVLSGKIDGLDEALDMEPTCTLGIFLREIINEERNQQIKL